MNIDEAIQTLRNAIDDPTQGLPDEVFYFISGITPMVNVDLLIKDENGRTLLSWRDDQYAGRGWHVPGGIIRFKEAFCDRIEKVAETEIGTQVKFESEPIAINEIMNPDGDIRAHFVSILYNCFLPGDFIPDNQELKLNDPGYLKWHQGCPDDLLKFHEVYRELI